MGREPRIQTDVTSNSTRIWYTTSWGSIEASLVYYTNGSYALEQLFAVANQTFLTSNLQINDPIVTFTSNYSIGTFIS